MASLLENYEQQFGIITATITAKTAKLASAAANGDERKAVTAQIVKDIEEARDILEQMGLEIRELNPASRNKFQTRIESYQAELTRLENEYKKNKNSMDRKREELFGENSEDFNDQKQSLIDNNEKLERGKKRLDVGYRVAIETEQIGNEILTDLNQQRETIQRTRNRLRETDEELGRSGRVLNRMITRVMQNRLILLGLVLLIFFVIIIAVYFGVRKNH